MMDLLVQITTAHKLSPGSHAIHAIGDRGILPYKPSTPIGELYYTYIYFFFASLLTRKPIAVVIDVRKYI